MFKAYRRSLLWKALIVSFIVSVVVHNSEFDRNIGGSIPPGSQL